MSPEFMRKENFEMLLKRRIFLADRQEKVEGALIKLGFLSKEILYCSPDSL